MPGCPRKRVFFNRNYKIKPGRPFLTEQLKSGSNEMATLVFEGVFGITSSSLISPTGLL
jgi:hypothetical protein